MIFRKLPVSAAEILNPWKNAVNNMHITSLPCEHFKSDETTTPYSFPVILKHDDRFSLYNFPKRAWVWRYLPVLLNYRTDSKRRSILNQNTFQIIF